MTKPSALTQEYDKGHSMIAHYLYQTENISKFMNLNPEKSMSILNYLVKTIIDKDLRTNNIHETDGVYCLHKIPPNPK